MYDKDKRVSVLGNATENGTDDDDDGDDDDDDWNGKTR